MKVILLSLILMFFAVPIAVNAADECVDQHIALTHVTAGTPAFVTSAYQDPTSDRVYVNYADKTYVSTDKGENWAEAYDWSGVSGALYGRHIYVTSAGTVFMCWGNTGKLHRLTWTGSALGNRTEPLTFEVNTSYFRENSIDQAPDGKIYVGEYGPAETAGNVWRSNDDGVTWTQIFDGDSQTIRHIHTVGVDPYHQTLGQYHVYMTAGDPIGGIPYGGIFKTVDPDEAVPTWECIMEETDSKCRYRPTAIAFTPNYRIFGTDVGFGEYEEGVIYNQIFRTTDDKDFTEELALERELGWQMRRDSRGIVYAGTMKGAGSTATFRIAIYCSSDEGDTWCELYGFDAALPSTYVWKGIAAFSNFKQRTAFVAINDYDNLPNHPAELYELNIGFTWHIDDSGGQDFTDITVAIADASTDEGDILVLHPGSYYESAIVPLENMQLVGTTAIPHDAIIWNELAGTNVFDIDNGGFRMENIECRGDANLTGTAAFMDITGSAYLKNVDFKNIDGANFSCISVTAGGTIRYNGGRIDSCSTSASFYPSVARIYTPDDVVLRNLIIGENTGYFSPIYIQSLSSPVSDSTTVEYCLFDNNSSTENGGALWGQFNNSATGPNVISHLTFYNNTCANSIEGQLFTGGNDAEYTIDHIVFYGDGTTYANNTGVTLKNANYCTAYNCGNSNIITAVSKIDCIDVDPNFTNLNRYSTTSFRARSLDDDSSGSSPRFTQDGSYMGWQQYIDIGGWHNNGYYKIRRRLFFF